jgi:delta-aminolevulinic acid dehydratase/porphobilinogen synthase
MTFPVVRMRRLRRLEPLRRLVRETQLSADRKRTILETLTSMRRAGADMILTYWATEVAGWL